jgi:hypothetical protein
MDEDKSSTELAIVALLDAIEKDTSNEAIEDVLPKLAEESTAYSEDFVFEEGDNKDRPSKPSHVCFDQSKMVKGHIEVLKNTK